MELLLARPVKAELAALSVHAATSLVDGLSSTGFQQTLIFYLLLYPLRSDRCPHTRLMLVFYEQSSSTRSPQECIQQHFWLKEKHGKEWMKNLVFSSDLWVGTLGGRDRMRPCSSRCGDTERERM